MSEQIINVESVWDIKNNHPISPIGHADRQIMEDDGFYQWWVQRRDAKWYPTGPKFKIIDENEE